MGFVGACLTRLLAGEKQLSFLKKYMPMVLHGAHP